MPCSTHICVSCGSCSSCLFDGRLTLRGSRTLNHAARYVTAQVRTATVGSSIQRTNMRSPQRSASPVPPKWSGIEDGSSGYTTMLRPTSVASSTRFTECMVFIVSSVDTAYYGLDCGTVSEGCNEGGAQWKKRHPARKISGWDR